jgi:hypothetical protein
MLVARHTNPRAKRLRCMSNAIVVSRDDNISGGTFHSALINMLQHRLAIDIAQWLPR